MVPAERGSHGVLSRLVSSRPVQALRSHFLLAIVGVCFPRPAGAGARSTHSFSCTFWPLSSARSESRETRPGKFPVILPGLTGPQPGLSRCAGVALLFRPGLVGWHLLPAPGTPEAEVPAEEPGNCVPQGSPSPGGLWGQGLLCSAQESRSLRNGD